MSSKHRLITLAALCILSAARSDAADASSVIAPGATLQQVSHDFQFTEGPASDSEGNVYFTDQPNDRIMKWSAADGSISTFLEPCGRSNGLCFDPKGRLIACAD